MSLEIALDKESQIVSKLHEALEREQTYLVDINIDQVQSILDEKAKLLQELSSYSQKRYKLLANAGHLPNESGMIDWLKRNRNDALNAIWLSMQQILLKTKELNRVNGILINKHFTRNQQQLNALQGKASGTHLYGRNGYATSNLGLRASITS